MKFSIIIPVYNVAEFISTCVDSVLAQSYGNFEIFLIDDGSTDNSPIICDEYEKRDKRIKVIHQYNMGVSVARNIGLSYATGEYVLFIDADDYWNDNDILAKLERIIKKNNFPDLIFNNSILRLMPKGRILEQHFEFKVQSFNNVSGEKALIYLFTEASDFPASVCTKVFRNKIIKENKLKFIEGVTLGEDADWLFRFILHTKKNLLIDIPYYCYRMNRPGSAMSSQSYKNLSTYLSIIDKWLNYANHITNLELANAIRTKFCDNYMNYFKYIYSFSPEERNTLISEIEKREIIKYVISPKNIELKKNIEKKGYKKALKTLYNKYVFRENIKQLAIKVGFIDR